MKVEIQAGHREMLSRRLLEALNDNVDRGEKSILFINRRGSASFVQCLSCGSIQVLSKLRNSIDVAPQPASRSR